MYAWYVWCALVQKVCMVFVVCMARSIYAMCAMATYVMHDDMNAMNGI